MTRTCRTHRASACALALSIAAALPSAAQPPQGEHGGDAWEINESSQQAVKRGLDYLARTQNPDGSWYSDIGFKLMDGYEVTTPVREQMLKGGGDPGVAALAGMAFMAGGNLPGQGRYSTNVEKALGYVLSCVKEDGYITDNGSRMYSHAFATLFLAEVYGMTRRSDVREHLQEAIDLVVKSQNASGSWRYVPYAQDSDMSITVCQVMALRAARNIGIRVPKSTIDRAVRYVKASAVREDGRSRGGFKYQDRPLGQTRASFPLTAAGVTTLYGAGIYADEDLQAGLEYLRQNYATARETYRDHYFFYYGNYYAVQAMFIAGSPHWDWYWPAVRNDLVNMQREDGSWKDNVGEAFATAMATIILQIPYKYLPIFQR
jgi:prenyltransferase/squalene oxidase-like repeat protein